jgi:ABC-type multidrug transport system fused ATPase/permease subunit
MTDQNSTENNQNPSETQEQETQEQEKKITRQGLVTGFRVMMKYLGGYRRQIVILSVIGILSALGNGVIPYIIGRFFDAIISPNTVHVLGFTMPLFVGLLILWSIVQLITSIMDWRVSITSQLLSNVVWFDYMAYGFGYLLNLPVSFHKTNRIGEVAQKITNAAGQLETIIANIVIDMAPQILSILVAFGITFYTNKVLGGVMIIGLLIYTFVLARNIKPLAQYQKEYWQHLSTKVWGENYDVVGNALAIKQATTEQYEQRKLTANAKAGVPLWMRQQKIWSNLSFYQRMTILGTQIAIFVLSVYFIRQGTMTIGELLAFNAYAAMIFGPFVTIARQWQTIQNGIISTEEAEKILQTPTEIYEPKNAPNIEFKGDINFKNVSFQYDQGKPVLQDISFSIKAGEVVALVGESGVGKSTLIDLISAYHFSNGGDVFIDGHNVKTLNLRKLRQAIGVVPQEVVLFNDTIETNIKYGNFESTTEQVREAARKAHALDFIEKFPDKWSQLVGERGIKLSVGQKQRIAIARAILRNPKILVLDEPTSALDAGTEKIITESLDQLMAGKTTFIIAHRLSTVRKADKILVFKEGKIVESGTHFQLLKLKNGEYKRLYDLQIGLHA